MAMTTCGIDIRPWTRPDAPAWAAFVERHPQGTLFHELAWSQAVQTAYGHQPLHLTAWQADRLVGVLPLVQVDSIFVGRALVSVPYGTYGGILAADGDAETALSDAAEDLARRKDAAYVELRHRDPSGLDLPEVGRYDTFRKELPDRPEDVLKAFPKKARAAARQGLAELTVAVGPDLLVGVYRLYARTMRRLGSPNYRYGLFRALAAAYGDRMICLTVRHGSRDVAGVTAFVFRDEIVPYFSGSTADGRRMNANNVMYLKLMELAVERGLRWFDFNRTRRDNRGPHAFKRHLGFEPTPLHYQVALNTAAKPADLTPSNPTFASARCVWRHLPLCLTRPLGSFVTKWLP